MRRRVLIVAVLLWVVVAFVGPAKAGDTPEDVSVVQLIATPEKFDGKFVRLIGFLCIAFEGDAIYLRREDLEKGIPRNGLWVDIPEKTDPKLSMHYVLVEGVFDANDHGHMYV
jgi:hypothetical protein